MTRLERDDFLMGVAKLCAKRSTCGRLQVGAVIADLGRIISTGYNGPPSGFDHCEKHGCNLLAVCTRTVHAESNAIAFAARFGIRTNGCSMYGTDSPCIDCAKLIVQAGIRRFIYFREYRDTTPLELMIEAGLTVKSYVGS
jgi:dCMP deaminase